MANIVRRLLTNGLNLRVHCNVATKAWMAAASVALGALFKQITSVLDNGDVRT
jgi:hypothetical protein